MSKYQPNSTRNLLFISLLRLRRLQPPHLPGAKYRRVAIRAAELIGKVLLEAVAVRIYIPFADAQMRGKSRTGKTKGRYDGGHANEEWLNGHEKLSPSARQLRADLRDFAAVLASSTVLALNVAPTEKITRIAGRLPPIQLLALLGASILLCYIIFCRRGPRTPGACRKYLLAPAC